MRPNQNKRMRGRSNSNRKGPNPLSRTYESNGPDVKIRGTAHHIGEKYLQLARDAQSSGDPVMAESFLQHAEHYFRLIAAAQAAQQAASGYQRQPGEADVDDLDEDEEFAGGMDRFASPAERAPQPNYQPQPQPQPAYPERERGGYANGDRPAYERPERGPRERNFQERSFQDRNSQERNPQERGQPQDRGFERPERGERGGAPGRDGEHRQGRGGRGGRDYRFDNGSRYERSESRAPVEEMDGSKGLPAFITSPVRLQPETHLVGSDEQPTVAADTLERPEAETDATGFHLRPRRRRRGKPELNEGQAEVSSAGDPIGD